MKVERIAAAFDPPPRAIGLVVLQSDQVMEAELRAWLPDATLLHTRIPNAPTVTPDTLAAMEAALPDAVRLLPAGVDWQAIGYGCTSGATVIGTARVAAQVRSVLGDVPVTDPLTAIKARLAADGIRRIGLLTPYTEDVSRAMVESLGADGVEVVRLVTFDEPDDGRVARLSNAVVRDALSELAHDPACDAVIGSCTNLRTEPFLEAVQREAGKPVLSSNAAFAWHLGRLASG